MSHHIRVFFKTPDVSHKLPMMIHPNDTISTTFDTIRKSGNWHRLTEKDMVLDAWKIGREFGKARLNQNRTWAFQRVGYDDVIEVEMARKGYGEVKKEGKLEEEGKYRKKYNSGTLV